LRHVAATQNVSRFRSDCVAKPDWLSRLIQPVEFWSGIRALC
jgi:hypothetical protein